MGGIGSSRHGVGGIGSSRGSSISSGRGSGVSSVGSVAGIDSSSVACVRGVVGDARGIGSNWGSSSVDIAGSNGGRSDRGCNSDRSCRRNSHRGGSRGNSNRGGSSNRATSRDDQQVGGGGVTVGDGLVLGSNCLLSEKKMTEKGRALKLKTLRSQFVDKMRLRLSSQEQEGGRCSHRCNP